MASCAQIERMFQAHIDGELGQSDAVILEHHLADCPDCVALLRSHQRACAQICEAFAADRLRHSLAAKVLEHVPDLEHVTTLDVEAVNWRAKHPVGRWARLARRMPAVAGAMLLILAVALVSQWPSSPGTGSGVIGVVTHAQGHAKYSEYDSVRRDIVALKGFVKRGQRYETGAGEALMLTLAGPTHVKLNQDTRVRLYDERKITVETGTIWLDVGKDGRLFRVITPSGGITVFGTVFEVSVDAEKTTVTVAEGRVQVENEVAFRELLPGQQAEIIMGAPIVPRTVDIAARMAWASRIKADQGAMSIFAKRVLAPGAGAQLRAQPVWVIKDLNGRAVQSIQLEWEPDGYGSGHSGYDVYVSDDKMQPLFKSHVAGRVFADKEISEYTIVVPGQPISGVNVLHIKIVPDFIGGRIETSFGKVEVLAIGA